MKIVYIIDHLRPDGTQTVLRQLVEGLASRGHQQAVICLNDSWDAGLVQQLRAAGASVRVVGRLPLASGVGLLATLHWLRREQFDVAVTLLFVADVVGRWLAHMARIPRLVSSIQNRTSTYHWWQRLLVRHTGHWVDALVSCSAAISPLGQQIEGIPAERTVVVPNSLRLSRYTATVDRHALRAELGLAANSVLLGSVGRLTHQKGLDVLLNALAQLAQPDLHLLIAGVGEQAAALHTQAHALGLAGQVHFAGYRRDLPRLLGGLDLYVHPSRYEGMPIAVLEAMASACPIVATAVDGTRELITDGQHGWLVPPDSPQHLATAIRQALANPTEAQRRGQAARQRVQTQFSEDGMLNAWETVMCQQTLS